MSLPHGAVGLSAVCECIVTFPGHTHLLFNDFNLYANDVNRIPNDILLCIVKMKETAQCLLIDYFQNLVYI